MRKIIFRGFSKYLCKWLYGDLEHVEQDHVRIWPIHASKDNRADDVSPESVGQYTGLKDSKGQEIYEGDILAFEILRGKNSRGCVEYSDEKAQYVVLFQQGKYERALFWVCAVGKPVVIGNIYETPELLEQEQPNA